MAANTSPIFSLTPNVGIVKLTTTWASVKSDGTCAQSGADSMGKVFTSGTNGSFLQRVRFNTVANTANTTGVATVLRVYLSTVTSGATAAADTQLLAEISVPAIASDHSTNGTNFYEVPLNIAIPTARYIYVSQHVAQTTNQQWQATAFGGDY